MPTSLLFICMGNICRSPMAEAIFRHKVRQAGLEYAFRIDSAGLGNWHAGEAPHRGTRAVLDRAGIAWTGQSARQLTRGDVQGGFDYLVTLDDEIDEGVRDWVARYRGSGQIIRLLDYADPAITGGDLQVPDPYYTGGFDRVYQLLDSACAGLLAHLTATAAQ